MFTGEIQTVWLLETIGQTQDQETQLEQQHSWIDKNKTGTCEIHEHVRPVDGAVLMQGPVHQNGPITDTCIECTVPVSCGVDVPSDQQ